MKNKLLLALCIALAPLAASADDLSYTYVEAGYARTDVDDVGDSGGPGINASVALGESFHLFGNFAAEQGRQTGIEVDQDTYRVGLGYRYAFGLATNLEANAYYENVTADATDGVDRLEIDGDAYGVELGVRGKMAPRLEGWAYAGYVKPDSGSVMFQGEQYDLDFGNEDPNLYGRVGGQFNLTHTWGIVVHASFDEDVVRSFLGVRTSF